MNEVQKLFAVMTMYLLSFIGITTMLVIAFGPFGSDIRGFSLGSLSMAVSVFIGLITAKLVKS